MFEFFYPFNTRLNGNKKKKNAKNINNNVPNRTVTYYSESNDMSVFYYLFP